MGCDIHVILEKKFGNRWIGMREVNSLQHFKSEEGVPPAKWKRVYVPSHATSRNYELFAALAGVRGEGPEPIGLPMDASELTLALYGPEDSDLHSHSWCPLHEYLTKLVETAFDVPDMILLADHPAVRHPMQYWFNAYEPEDGEEYRVVFCFDN